MWKTIYNVLLIAFFILPVLGYVTRSCKKDCDLKCSTKDDRENICFSKCKKGSCTMDCHMHGDCFQQCRDRAKCYNISCHSKVSLSDEG